MKDKRLIAVPVLIVLLLAAWLVFRNRDQASGDIQASGTVEATEADLGFQLGGRVDDVLVKEGDRVQRGDVLARIDQDELSARRQAATAQAEGARALLRELQRGARPQERSQAQSAVEAARRRMQDAQSTLTRTKKLYEGGAVSREALEQAETAYGVAKAQAEQTQQQQSLVDVGPREERVAAQSAVVRQADAAVQQAQAAIDNAVVLAPFAGVVTVRHREPGESVSPGMPVVTLMNPDDRWVRIYVREDQIGKVRVGETARITSDSHPGTTYRGRVTFIANQAEFTPRNVQTAEERVKLVYSVKIAVVGDAQMDLKPGVPADVVLEITPR